jgi:starch synthase
MSQDPALKVAMFSAEAVPYIKVGGLADVVGALAAVLNRQGVAVQLTIPAYKLIHHHRHNFAPYAALPGFEMNLGPNRVNVEVYHAIMPDSGVEVFLIGGGNYFFREGVYDDPFTREGYRDNMERFVFFMKAGMELLVRLGRPVDVLHCHDSQTGLIPGLLRTSFNQSPLLSKTGVLFTIHNLAYQSIFPRESLALAGIDERRYFHSFSPFEFWHKVNCMKAAVEYADLINTVSETYALEIQSGPEYGYGLEGVLRRRIGDLSGIVNGIDYHEWNPETDTCLPAHFSSPEQPGKAICKASVLASFGLPRLTGRIPLVGIVSRLAAQKGFDLIEAAIDRIARMNLQMVVLGTGQHEYHRMLQALAARYPEKFGFQPGFNNALGHQILAGSDMVLMPSHYEPCGLNQLYGLRYGTVPVVRATGGLVDTVTDFDPAANKGTGFSFRHYSPDDLVSALDRAIRTYADAERWTDLSRRGMAQDWSWERSAKKYVQLYETIRHRKAALQAPF